MIRKATLDDKEAIAKIWRANSKMLGGVGMSALVTAINNSACHVAEIDGEILGFVEFYRRKTDNWNTIYHIATIADKRNQGVGAALLWSVPCPIRLKVTADNESAIRFYEKLNMVKVSEEMTKKRDKKLFVYELRAMFIQCAGNNKQWPELCQKAGIAYGSRHDDQIRAWPSMIDINWKKYDWNQYLEIIKTHRPIMAMVADYERPEQKDLMLSQVQALRDLGVLRVMVCPKFDEAIADIPDDCVIAVSVPSKYAGYIPPMTQLKGKKVHLLGGSPVKQREYFMKINGAGACVISIDGNSHTSADGRLWRQGRWQFFRDGSAYYDLVAESAKNIAQMFQSIEYKQLSLFGAQL